MALGSACASPGQARTTPSVEPDLPDSAPPPGGAEQAEASEPAVKAELEPLRVATWNLRRFGHGERDLEAIAEVMDDYDLIAIQELMTKEAAESLLEGLAGYAVLYTDDPRPVSGSHREYYAFFYRLDRLDAVFNSYVPDPGDRFVREPFVACFALERRTRDLCVVDVHIVWGDGVGARKAEILALDDALRWAQSARDEADWIVMGDYNRPLDDGDADREPELEWAELLDRRGLREPLSPAGPEQPSTLGAKSYANSYDHIFVSRGLVHAVRGGGRRDIVSELCGGDFAGCKARLSDHAPVWVEVDLTPTSRGAAP